MIGSKSFSNAVGGFLCGFGICAGFRLAGAEQDWFRKAPGMPALALGLTFRHNEHGDIRYFSAFQATAFASLPLLMLPLAGIGFWLAPKMNGQGQQGWLWFRFTWDADDPSNLVKTAALVGAVSAPFILTYFDAPVLHRLVAAGWFLNPG